MTLLERTIAHETCAVRECVEPRQPDSDCCARHTTDKWMRRLLRMGDGTYSVSRLSARDDTWRDAA